MTELHKQPDPPEDVQEKIKKDINLNCGSSEIVIRSLRIGFIISVLMLGLYHYDKLVKPNKGKHTIRSFLYLFISISASFYTIQSMAPSLYPPLTTGMGWGIGAFLVKTVLN